MNLQGKKVKIIVSEPWNWEENLFGTILSERVGQKLLIELTKTIIGTKLSSNLIELSPRYEKTSFNTLSQNYSVTVGGALVTKDTDEFDYIIIGDVILE